MIRRQKQGEALPRTYNQIDEPEDRDRSEYRAMARWGAGNGLPAQT